MPTTNTVQGTLQVGQISTSVVIYYDVFEDNGETYNFRGTVVQTPTLVNTNPEVASTLVEGLVNEQTGYGLVITALSVGNTVITVTATAPNGNVCLSVFDVTVIAAAPIATSGTSSFNSYMPPPPNTPPPPPPPTVPLPPYTPN